MAPANEDENRPCSGHPANRSDIERERPEDNPFIAFRRYADEHVSSLLQSIIGLPSMIFPPSTNEWLIFDDEELNKAMKSWRRLADEEFNKPKNNNSSQRSHEYTDGRRLGDGEDWENHAAQDRPDPWRFRRHRYHNHAFPCTVFDAILDSHLPFGAFPFSSESSFLRGPSDAVTASWPLSYILLSPYSPLHLERQQQLDHKTRDHGLISWASSLLPTHDIEPSKEPCWRDAFEDLLRVENGKEILDRDTLITHKEESGKDWLAGMIERGSLGDGWEHVRRDGGRWDYFKYHYEDRFPPETNSKKGLRQQNREIENEKEEELTELDLYDAFLRDVNDDDDRVPKSPLLSIILETREKQRKELEELRKQWRAVNDRDHLHDDVSPELSNTTTELDHYERQFNSTSQGRAASNVQADTSIPSEPSADSSRVVSTVTTKEHRTLPDGTVRTKVVVNKRFADGREESVETEEISNKVQPHRINTDSGSSNGAAAIPETEASDPTGRNKRRGWFWSD
ncbi:hypothetical protein PRK78_001577 [Emydomyces testavorans]|uniref:Uncharacterized protein n=1 Tax=Emydomyces testavorans TaxID=2070801 RepID=A0AAF0IGT9_9EURO|nr:hypothetical protein PRK78_001577 [Emydomyces testavorans]